MNDLPECCIFVLNNVLIPQKRVFSLVNQNWCELVFCDISTW